MRPAWPKYLTIAICCLALFLFFPPLRNLVLYVVWPNAWRDVSTFDIIMISNFPSPDDVTLQASCDFSNPHPPFIHPADQASLSISNFRDESSPARPLKSSAHSVFLPAMERRDKEMLFQMYLVMASAFKSTGIAFFIRGGSLIGVHRHRGLIPWDDDIDIALNVTDWLRVRDVLSCIEGYRLEMAPSSNTHWKFHPAGTAFPFIDLFFFAENQEFVWALTPYTRHTFLLRKADVFPLTTGRFEGLQVPVPRRTDKILKALYHFSRCESRSSNHKTGESSTVVAVPCTDLTYMFDMYNLDP
ncbi:uncharacterized protein LOC101851052 [Aplysia californica]|uniref:Uncharacterized protein LOC101851052 n=1 Tax=Aplysia californica TaxID=6500 RepID=A0ABM0JUG7_APLCA|nr:uncharacterized protein LOC101851052 [Aplysia californica]